MFIDSDEELQQHFMGVVKADIVSQTTDRIFIDREVYQVCFEEIFDVWEKTDFNAFLTHHCTESLSYNSIQHLTDGSLSNVEKISRFCCMGRQYGYHAMYMAMKLQKPKNSQRTKAIQALERTGQSNCTYNNKAFASFMYNI